MPDLDDFNSRLSEDYFRDIVEVLQGALAEMQYPAGDEPRIALACIEMAHRAIEIWARRIGIEGGERDLNEDGGDAYARAIEEIGPRTPGLHPLHYAAVMLRGASVGVATAQTFSGA